MWSQQGDAWGPQELGAAGRTLPWRLWRERSPVTPRLWTLASRAGIGQISVVLPPPVVIFCGSPGTRMPLPPTLWPHKHVVSGKGVLPRPLC